MRVHCLQKKTFIVATHVLCQQPRAVHSLRSVINVFKLNNLVGLILGNQKQKNQISLKMVSKQLQ